MKRGKLSAFLSIAGAATLALAIALGLALLALREVASSPSPDPLGLPPAQDQQESTHEADEDEGLWPEVDWDWWHAANPDVVRWISIPGSEVSQPIVQASPVDPHFYLAHDAYGKWNPYGAIYLDVTCAREGGLDALLDQLDETGQAAESRQPTEDGGIGQQEIRNLILYGHHCRDGAMFSAIVQYADAAWAEDHPTVLLQTPQRRCVLNLAFASVVNNETRPKRIAFQNDADWEAWYAEEKARAQVVADVSPEGDEAPRFTVSLVTCSYRLFPDERTVAVAAPAA